MKAPGERGARGGPCEVLTTGGHSAGPAARLTGGTRAPLRSRRPGGCAREAPARSRHGLSPDDDPNLTQTEREKRPWTHEAEPGGRTRTESGSAGTHSLTGPAPSRSPRTRHPGEHPHLWPQGLGERAAAAQACEGAAVSLAPSTPWPDGRSRKLAARNFGLCQEGAGGPVEGVGTAERAPEQGVCWTRPCPPTPMPRTERA